MMSGAMAVAPEAEVAPEAMEEDRSSFAHTAGAAKDTVGLDIRICRHIAKHSQKLP